MKHQIRNIVWASIVLLLVGACSSGKKLFKVDTLAKNTHTINQIKAAYPDFESLSARLKIDSELFEKKSPLKGTIKIIPDSAILLNMNLNSGFPVAKIFFTRDSFQLLDRINKEYISGTYADFNDKYKLSVDFDGLQSLLLNRLIGQDYFSDYQVKEISQDDSHLYAIHQIYQPNKDETPTQISYLADQSTHRILSTNILFSKTILDINYKDFKKQNGKLHPLNYSILIKSEKKTTLIDINWSKIQFDKKQKINFKVPDKYMND